MLTASFQFLGIHPSIEFHFYSDWFWTGDICFGTVVYQITPHKSLSFFGKLLFYTITALVKKLPRCGNIDWNDFLKRRSDLIQLWNSRQFSLNITKWTKVYCDILNLKILNFCSINMYALNKKFRRHWNATNIQFLLELCSYWSSFCELKIKIRELENCENYKIRELWNRILL